MKPKMERQTMKKFRREDLSWREPRKKFQLHCPDEDRRTKQSFKDECDINNIMKHYKRDGLVSHVARQAPEYGDFTNAGTYQDACNALIRADAAFMSLPALVRKRMNNDPGQFLEFMADPANEDEQIKLGLIDPKPKLPPEAKAEPTPGSGEATAD